MPLTIGAYYWRLLLALTIGAYYRRLLLALKA